MTIELCRDGARPLRIGHRGAPALAPENTLRSLAQAVEHPLDFVELDVISTADGQLVLGHSYDLRELTHGAVRGSGRPRSLAGLREVAPDLTTLDEALAFLTAEAPDLGVQIDLKEMLFADTSCSSAPSSAPTSHGASVRSPRPSRSCRAR